VKPCQTVQIRQSHALASRGGGQDSFSLTTNDALRVDGVTAAHLPLTSGQREGMGSNPTDSRFSLETVVYAAISCLYSQSQSLAEDYRLDLAWAQVSWPPDSRACVDNDRFAPRKHAEVGESGRSVKPLGAPEWVQIPLLPPTAEPFAHLTSVPTVLLGPHLCVRSGAPSALQGLVGVWVSQSSRAFATGSGYVGKVLR
jgi:hypothetical protein